MSWLFSRALVAEYSRGTCSAGEPCALLSETPMPHVYSPPGRTTEFSRLSRFGMTCEPLTEDLGAGVLTWFLAGFRVRPTARRLREQTMQTISGRKCDGSWQMQLPGTYLPRTLPGERLTQRQTTLRRWVTKSDALPLPRETWVQTTYGSGIGYLHTPTTAANYCAPSMMKHACARAFRSVFGEASPSAHLWLMGWPARWTSFASLATGRFQQWRSQHCLSFAREEHA